VFYTITECKSDAKIQDRKLYYFLFVRNSILSRTASFTYFSLKNTTILFPQKTSMRLSAGATTAVVLLVAMTMDGSSESAEAFSSSEGGGKIPELPPPDPNSDLPTIRLGESIR